MLILVGCERTQAVTIELRALGHEAYSCDLLPCTGGYPQWHLTLDVFTAIDSKRWDMAIFFPPCTYLTISGNRWFRPEYKARFPNRPRLRLEAIRFVIKLWRCGIPRIAIENPIGVLSTQWRKPSQIIQPYFFGDPHPKSTCLWLKNLPLLYHSSVPDLFNSEASHVVPTYRICPKSGKRYSAIHYVSGWSQDRSFVRSKTYPGIASAMAQQWVL